MMTKEFIKLVAEVQSELKAPKGQRNAFGNYNYRSCEDILKAVKPLLAERNLVLVLSDELVSGGQVIVDGITEEKSYIKVTATITDGESSISNTAIARESYNKKGMDSAQISGSTSSYARKYALNGLLGIDDTKDADATNKHGKTKATPAPKKASTSKKSSSFKASDKVEESTSGMGGL